MSNDDGRYEAMTDGEFWAEVRDLLAADVSLDEFLSSEAERRDSRLREIRNQKRIIRVTVAEREPDADPLDQMLDGQTAGESAAIGELNAAYRQRLAELANA